MADRLGTHLLAKLHHAQVQAEDNKDHAVSDEDAEDANVAAVRSRVPPSYCSNVFNDHPPPAKRAAGLYRH
jgi:Zn-dependent protease with chaperone function